jgi:hypothetical protein
MEFAMRKKMIEDLRNNYEHEGVVLTIKTSKEKRVVLKCDRGGEYVNVLNLTDESGQSVRSLAITTTSWVETW